LPQFDDELDLYSALQNAELTQSDAEWVGALSEEEIEPWRALLGRSSAGDLRVAIRLLSIRASATALSHSVMSVMPHQYETDSPFFDLVAQAKDSVSPHSEPLRNVIQQCRLSAGLAHARMDERGVSADLVFRLDLVIAQLIRMEELLNVMENRSDGRAFAAVLLRAVASEAALGALLRNSVNRVARRVVVHTGKSGEHYIAGSAAEWKSMGYGAVGAGVITAFTALFKYLFGTMQMAPLWIGVAHSLNYTVSFVLMQFLGWRLASKMPSMTAAALWKKTMGCIRKWAWWRPLRAHKRLSRSEIWWARYRRLC
jgi:site-specific recombinase